MTSTETIRAGQGGRLVQDWRPASPVGVDRGRYNYSPNGFPPMENRDLTAVEMSMLEQPLIRLVRNADTLQRSAS